MQGKYAICTGKRLEQRASRTKPWGKGRDLKPAVLERATHTPGVLLEGAKKGLCRRGTGVMSRGTLHRGVAAEGVLVPNFPNHTLLSRPFPPCCPDWSTDSWKSGIWALIGALSARAKDTVGNHYIPSFWVQWKHGKDLHFGIRQIWFPTQTLLLAISIDLGKLLNFPEPPSSYM